MEIHPLVPSRIRRPRGPYGWVDLRPVTQGHLEALDTVDVLTYLFLCAVGNSDGVSFWGRSRISRVLHVPETAIGEALVRLQQVRLIAFRDRLVQVLPVPETPIFPPAKPECRSEGGASVKAVRASDAEVAIDREPVDPAELSAHQNQARQQLEKILGRPPSETVVTDMALGLVREARRQAGRQDKGSSKP